MPDNVHVVEGRRDCELVRVDECQYGAYLDRKAASPGECEDARLASARLFRTYG